MTNQTSVSKLRIDTLVFRKTARLKI